MDKLINAVIKLQEVSKKSGQYGQIAKIKGDDNHTYTVFEQKKDGSISAAWEQLGGLQLGQSVQIGYVENPGTFTDKETGQTKNYISRIIRVFNTDIGSGVQNHENRSSQGQIGVSDAKPDNFGLRLAIHGMVNGLLAGGNTPQQVSGLLPDLFRLEEDIEIRLNKPVSMNTAEAKINKFSDGSPVDDLPEIQQEDINVEDIPF